MKNTTFELLEEDFTEFPQSKASSTPSDEEILAAANILNVCFHEPYVEFLHRYGGGMVGSLPVFGLRPVEMMGSRWSVVDTTQWYREDGWPGCDHWYVVSEDGFGNPIGVSEDGQVRVYDHDAGQEYIVAGDFESFLTEYCFEGT